jgi:hypothetical protein
MILEYVHHLKNGFSWLPVHAMNTQREDLSDAEKGNAVLKLWSNYDKYKTIKRCC